MSRQAQNKSTKSRMVLYKFGGDFDETIMEKLLNAAQKKGIVYQFDTGRGGDVWFEGSPGKPMRELKVKVEALLSNKRDFGTPH